MALSVDEVKNYVFSEAKNCGYIVLDFKPIGPGYEVVIDKEEQGITVDECGEFNRKLVKWIQENLSNTGNYSIDVCSPGLDRVLVTDNDFKWAEGKEVFVLLEEHVNDKKEYRGKLISYDPGVSLCLETEGGNVSFTKTNIKKIKLSF